MNFKGKSAPILLVSAILALNSLGLAVITAILLWDSATQASESLGGALFLDLLLIASVVATVFVIRFFWRGAPGSRSAIIVWQMLLIGVGIASAQGAEPRFDYAALLIIPSAVVTIFMLWSREVSRHLRINA